MLLPKPPPPLKVDKKAHKPAKIFTDIYTLQNRSTLDDECRSDPLIWYLEMYISLIMGHIIARGLICILVSNE